MTQETVLNIGDTTTLDKPVSHAVIPPAHKFADVIHIDIGYGCSSGLGGVKYALFAVDRATRHRYIYPISSLAEDTLPSFHNLLMDLGQVPRRIITDFDHKLMGKTVRNYLQEKGCILESAPPKHQHQNGLVERNWRTLVRMARSWLNSSLLPSSFWFHAIKRACEIKNYLPVNLKGLITTPHELVYHVKPDMRCLFPMFSVAYIDKEEDSNTQRGNFSSLTLRVIVIGKSSIEINLIYKCDNILHT